MSQAGQFNIVADVESLTGDVGGAVTPTAGNIDILGGEGITVTGTPSTLTITHTGIVASSFPTDAGTAIPVAGELEIAGSTNINTAGAGNAVTVTLNDDVILAGYLAATDLVITSDVEFTTITDGGLITDAAGVVQASGALTHATGFATWTGVGTYFNDVTLGTFVLIRGGTGYVNSVPVTWAGGQTVTGMVAGNTYIIYIDNTGTIGKTTDYTQLTFDNYIVLFQCLRDSTGGTNIQYTVKENHPSRFCSCVSWWAHEVIGTVIENNDRGANIVLNGTQKIQINGADELADHGLYTDIPDSGGVGVLWKQMLTNGSGKWITYVSSDTFDGTWNNAGTATAPTGTKYSIYTLYVSKDDLNVVTPTYWAVLDDQEYNNLAAAQLAVAAGTMAIATTELAQLEFAQLGFIIYKQNTTEIIDVIIEKETAQATTAGGGASNDAALILTNTALFDGILSNADTNVQISLETIDEWGKTTTDHAILIGNGTGNPIGSLAVGATGEMIIGNTGADPTWSATGALTTLNATTVNATTVNGTTFDTNVVAAGVTLNATSLLADGTDANIDINITAKGTGHVIIDDLTLTNDLIVDNGGTGASTFTDHGVLVGSGVSAITALGVATNGQLIIGSTGADPVVASITSTDSSITISVGAGTLDLSTNYSVTWSEQTGGAQAMLPDNGYILNNAGLVTATLPATAAIGTIMRIVGKGAGGWAVAQRAGQTIHFGNTDTTPGAGGSLASTNRYDCVSMVCITADTDFVILSSIGNITIV